jgi:LuxR family maltose regulon positive regulatory protein
MASPILITKLFIPPTRAELVQRPDLIERLNNGLDRKLTLLSAPAGFGKTTLVSYWLEQLRENKSNAGQKIRFSWLSLDKEDNDLNRFLTYFVSALNHTQDIETKIGEGALNILKTPQPPPASDGTSLLISDS